MTTVRTDWDAPIPTTWALVALLVAVHLVTGGIAWDARHANAWFAWFGERPDRARILVGGQFHPLIPSQPWRLWTSGLLHVSALHLAINAIAMVTLGRLVEPMVGGLRLVGTFALGIVTGSLLSHGLLIVQSDGASGGAFALLAALVVFARRHRDELDDDDRHLLGPVLTGLLAANLVLGLVIPPLDAVGHIGGALGGAVAGWIWTTGKAGRGWWVWVAVSALVVLGGWATAIATAR